MFEAFTNTRQSARTAELTRLLTRVDVVDAPSDLVDAISTEFGLGTPHHFSSIPVGYEELNLLVVTTLGKYLIKVFSKTKQFDVVNSYVNGLVSFREAGVPCPRLVSGKSGYVFRIEGKARESYACVMEYFDGHNFVDVLPTQEDVVTLTRYVALIHDLSFKVKREYDSWGTVNLVSEYNKKCAWLDQAQKNHVNRVTQKFQSIDFSRLKKCVIHGDLQRSNILKNKDDKFCIVDLGCLDFNAAVVDIAVFLAQFCYEPGNAVRNANMFELVVGEYTRESFLSPYEISVLPTLVDATYAAYLLAANHAVRVLHDTSEQTQRWLQRSRTALEEKKGIAQFQE